MLNVQLNHLLRSFILIYGVQTLPVATRTIWWQNEWCTSNAHQKYQYLIICESLINYDCCNLHTLSQFLSIVKFLPFNKRQIRRFLASQYHSLSSRYASPGCYYPGVIIISELTCKYSNFQAVRHLGSPNPRGKTGNYSCSHNGRKGLVLFRFF